MASRRRTLSAQLAVLALLTLGVNLGDLSGAKFFTGGGGPYYTDRVTSATTITTPSSDYVLSQVQLEGGSTPGALQLNYSGTELAVFPTPSNGTRGRATYNVTYAVGSTLSSGQQTFSGGLAAVTFRFKLKGADAGPQMAGYRGLYFAVTAAGAQATITAFTAQNFAGSKNTHPTAYVAYTSAGNAQVYPPSVSSVQDYYDAIPVDYTTEVYGCPLLADAGSLTPSYTCSAACTIGATFYY